MRRVVRLNGRKLGRDRIRKMTDRLARVRGKGIASKGRVFVENKDRIRSKKMLEEFRGGRRRFQVIWLTDKNLGRK